jgi:natural product precursor
MDMKFFEAEKLSAEEMNPITGGGGGEYSVCTTGNNSTNSAGSDTDTKNSDSDSGMWDDET